MALGLVRCGVESVPNERWRVDLSFSGAWGSWAYRDGFPQVTTDIKKGLNGSIAMTRATESKHTMALFWETGRELNIYSRGDGWDIDDEDAVGFALSVIDGDVPLEGWVSLARNFLERLSPKQSSDTHGIA
jgi:hypothetical protein